MINTNLVINDDLKKLIEDRLASEIDKEMSLAEERFNKRKVEIIAGLLVDVMQIAHFNGEGNELVFTVKRK